MPSGATTRLAAALLAFLFVTLASRADEPRLARITDLIGTLASPEFAGRSGPKARLTADLLVERFKGLGLAPLFAGSFEQPIPGAQPNAVIGQNIGGWLEGSDPTLAQEWILVAAHYDHLGVRGGRLFPGADDNASGVAMLVEVATALANGERPRRSVAFVSFDREEDGLVGSRHFVEHPPRPLESMRLLLVADMIGRSLGNVCPELVFLIGTEHTPGLRPRIVEAARQLPLRVGLISNEVLLFDRSDYGPFRTRQIPYLFFTTGQSPVYHRPDDRPETIDFPKVEAISTLATRIATDAANSDTLPGWTDPPVHEIEEARVIHDVLARLLKNADDLGMTPLQRIWLKAQIRDLGDAIERGRLTPEERRRMLSNAQLVIYTIL